MAERGYSIVKVENAPNPASPRRRDHLRVTGRPSRRRQSTRARLTLAPVQVVSIVVAHIRAT